MDSKKLPAIIFTTIGVFAVGVIAYVIWQRSVGGPEGGFLGGPAFQFEELTAEKREDILEKLSAAAQANSKDILQKLSLPKGTKDLSEQQKNDILNSLR